MLHIFNKNSQNRSVSFLGFFDEFLHALPVVAGTVLAIKNGEDLNGLFHLFKTNFFLSLSIEKFSFGVEINRPMVGFIFRVKVVLDQLIKIDRVFKFIRTSGQKEAIEKNRVKGRTRGI